MYSLVVASEFPLELEPPIHVVPEPAVAVAVGATVAVGSAVGATVTAGSAVGSTVGATVAVGSTVGSVVTVGLSPSSVVFPSLTFQTFLPLLQLYSHLNLLPIHLNLSCC